MASGFKAIETRYGVTVVSEGYHYDFLRGKSIETFKFYSADGCCWEKGLSRRGVKAECERWAKELMSIRTGF